VKAIAPCVTWKLTLFRCRLFIRHCKGVSPGWRRSSPRDGFMRPLEWVSRGHPSRRWIVTRNQGYQWYSDYAEFVSGTDSAAAAEGGIDAVFIRL